MFAKPERGGEPTPWRKRLNKMAYRAYSWPDRTRRRPETVVILSHMRSGSTLLTHLLTSHPDICGYGETHLTYSHPSDLDALPGKLQMVLRRPCGSLRARYVLDKILHECYLSLAHLPLLEQRGARVIFLVREPRGALISLINAPGFQRTEEEAVQSYRTRLCYLAEAAPRFPAGRPAAVTYDQLTDQPAPTLRLLERFLDLSAPLTEQYRLQRTTGHMKIGDTSANIRAGVILRDDQKASLPETPLSSDSLRQAQDAYDACWAAFQEHCTTLG